MLKDILATLMNQSRERLALVASQPAGARAVSIAVALVIAAIVIPMIVSLWLAWHMFRITMYLVWFVYFGFWWKLMTHG